MEQNTKKNLIFGGSVAAAALIGLGAGLGIGFGTSGGSSNSVDNNIEHAANTKGIGAFSNLESFDNDGFNYGVRQSTIEYLDGQTTSGVEEQYTYETKTSQYSDDGAIYVDMIEDYYSTNDIIISAGFQVANAITGADADYDGTTDFGGVFTDIDGNDTEFANSDSKAFVLMDDSLLSTNYDNAASISFAAEGAGYMAGIAASAYTQYDATTNEKENPNIVMWGGNSFNTVYDFMSGFEQAVTDYTTATGFEITLWSGGTDANTTDTTGFTADTQTDSKHWYTWGFDADVATEDGALAQTKTNNALANGASVVFPVAGGNTTVAENAIAGAGSTTTRIMGVDADSTLSASHPELFLGTAEKNLTVGGQYGLWAMDDFNHNGVRNYEEVEITGVDGYITLNPTDTYFAENSSNMTEWYETGVASITGATIEGVQLRGDAANGGVGFLVGGTRGGNTDLVTAISNLTGEEYDKDRISEEIASIAASTDIAAESATFTDLAS